MDQAVVPPVREHDGVLVDSFDIDPVNGVEIRLLTNPDVEQTQFLLHSTARSESAVRRHIDLDRTGASFGNIVPS